MTFYYDKHVRFFYGFLLSFFLLLISAAAILLYIVHTQTELIEPFFSYSVFAVIFILSAYLFCGAFLFFRKREMLYKECASTIKCYIDGDYSRHLPKDSEGTIYYVFHLVEELATILQSKNEMEYRSKEFLKNTISDISHQLKTPLAALSIYQEIMEKEPERPDVVRQFSQKTGLALRRMESLIQSMLKLTRLDAGSIVFAKKSCKIPDLIEHALTELTTRSYLEEKHIIVTQLREDVFDNEYAKNDSRNTPAENVSTLVCDPEWTSEAIGNIVKNALEHTKAGDTIRIAWEYSPFMVRIVISDNGEGIAPEDIYHIFKRFYRSKNASATQGTGLGLSLAKSIIEGQGGVLSVKSILQEGTSFTLTFMN